MPQNQVSYTKYLRRLQVRTPNFNFLINQQAYWIQLKIICVNKLIYNRKFAALTNEEIDALGEVFVVESDDLSVVDL